MTNQVLDTIRLLRSVHWDFTDKPVSRDAIKTIVSHSMNAANNNDRMDLSVILVEDPEILNIITQGDSQNRSIPTLIYVLDYTRMVLCARRLGHSYDPHSRLYNFLYGLQDAGAAAQTAVIAAKSMGIDSLVTNFAHRNDPEKILRLLNLPQEHCFPVIQVALGYKDEAPFAKRSFPIEQVFHDGQYRMPTDADLDAVIAQMDKAYPSYITEKNPHALDWFYKEWWIEHYNQDMHSALAAVLMRSGLLREPGLACE